MGSLGDPLGSGGYLNIKGGELKRKNGGRSKAINIGSGSSKDPKKTEEKENGKKKKSEEERQKGRFPAEPLKSPGAGKIFSPPT